MKNFVPLYLQSLFLPIASSFRKSSKRSFEKIALGMVLMLIVLFSVQPVFGQLYYRSKESGNWNSTSTWQSSSNGINWSNASSTPVYSNANTITIQNGHTVTISSDLTINQVVVAAGGEVILANGVNLTISNGSGTDFDVYGTFRNGTGSSNGAGGTITQNYGSTMVFENGGTYQHGFTNLAGTIPTATWATGSTCEIDGYTSLSGTISARFDQNFYNLTWNCPNQSNNNGINLDGDLTTVNGNFNMISTGSGNLQLGNNSNFTTTIGGDYNQSGGTLIIVKSSHTGEIDLKGNFIMSDGTLKRNGGTDNFNFSGTDVQTITKTGGDITGSLKFYVNSGATVDFGTSVLDGSGPTFTASAGATIKTANPDGFAKSGSNGSVQVSGSRTFSDGVNFVYDGNQNQDVGNALAQNNPANVTIANTGASGNNVVTLNSNTTISGDLTISNGVFSAGDNNRNFTIQGNWINNGGSFNGGTSTVTFDGTTQSIGGTASTDFPDVDLNAGAVVTLNKSATATSLTLDAANASTSLTQNSGVNLSISGNVTIKQPSSNLVTTAWNINGGSASVNGNITLGGTNNNITRIAKVAITSGTLTVSGDFIFNSSSSNSSSAVLDMSGGAGTLNIAGDLNIKHNSGMLLSSNSSTINFNGTTSQTIPMGVSDVVYNNIYTNNTSSDGAVLDGDVTLLNTTGNIWVQSGTFDNGGNLIVGNPLKTFQVADDATFRLSGTSIPPTGFLNQLLANSSVTEFAGTDQSIIKGTFGELKIAGSGTKTLSGAITVKGDITINNGTALDLSSNNYGVSLTGNWINNGTLTPHNGTITFNGSAVQTIGGDVSSAFKNLTIDNTAGVTLAKNVSVDGVLTFKNGLITTSDTDLLTLNAGSSISGAGLDKFVDGPMKKIGNTAFTFPVGKSSVYAPVSISAPANASDAFTAEYMRANAKALGPITASGLVFVSACEYWMLERTSGTSSVDVTLSWSGASPCSASSYVTDPSQLVVAHFNGTSWNAFGNDGGYTGNVSSGTVTWKNVSTFSPFSFGSNSPGANPLPVKFDYVKAIQKNNYSVEIDWRTLTEKNVDHYEIESSKDGQNFTTIGSVTATGNNASSASYTWLDANYTGGVVFYRIKSVDINNEYRYSEVVKVDQDSSSKPELSLYPNPVMGGQVSIDVNNIAPGIYTVQVYDNNGRNLYSQAFNHHGGTFSQLIQLPSGLNSGIYSMRVNGNGLNLLKSFLVK